MYRNINKKIFHIVMVIVIIFAILCVGGIFILRYQVEGEANMPFKITKISLVESVEGTEKDNASEKWNFNVNQNNDIYIYIEKNSGYGKTEIIDSVEIKNIDINKEKKLGETKLYKPVTEEKRMFTNSQENEITEITYNGELESNIKEEKISNQGGIVAFRYAINNLATYISNNEEQINHSQLLKLTNIKQEDLQTKITFDIIINLKSKKKYQAQVNIDVPQGDIIEKGTVGIDITDLKYGDSKNITFKVTSGELLKLTNGIVQGMSGSPIIQNGKIIGAVTHVFVDDSTCGYGIFIDRMLDKD